jgi:hypothetical protein
MEKLFKTPFSALFGIALMCMMYLGSNSYGSNRGNSETRAENDDCESGVMVFCGGSGNLCSHTIGWDCEPMGGPQQ